VTRWGSLLFQAVLEHFQQDSGPVPFLVIGDTILIGSQDIPEQLPGLIEQRLAQGGQDWPQIPAVLAALAQTDPTAGATTPPVGTPSAGDSGAGTPQAAQVTAAATPGGMVVLTPAAGSILPQTTNNLWEKFSQDLAGNTLALFALVGMLAVFIGAIAYLQREAKTTRLDAPRRHSLSWLVPVLCALGLGVAAYLAYVETSQVQAFCGPVGDCNTVQQSEYARLFGILPIGVLGVVGYVLILVAWLFSRSSNLRTATLAATIQLGLSTIGLLFSIYLTFLEPFVIGATCAWCLTSAVIMTAIFVLSLPPWGKQGKTIHRDP
jgi:uncharacterized membrane protein